MYNCPICNTEMQDNFPFYRNCKYSLTKNRVAEFRIFKKGTREIRYQLCNMKFLVPGVCKFHEGFTSGIDGSFIEIFPNIEISYLNVISNCGNVEFVIQKKEADHKIIN